VLTFFVSQEITNYEFSLWTKSGLRKDILWSATGRRDRHGNIVGVIGIGHDRGENLGRSEHWRIFLKPGKYVKIV
jgi:hypothetical protein